MIYGVETVLYYRAWDTAANSYKTGDAANHALHWNKDGSAAATTNAPAEVDGTNQPGLYKVTITAAEAACLSGALGGKSSTSGVALFFGDVGPVRLPNAAPGGNGGLATVDANNRIAGIQGTKTTLDALNDLSAAGVNAEADAALADAGVTTTVTGRIDAAVSSRSSHSAGDVRVEMDANSAQLAAIVDRLLTDAVIDTATTPWTLKIYKKGTATLLATKELKQLSGDDVTSASQAVGSQVEAGA